MRTEFGVERTSCACKDCVSNCEHMPGYLIPADLKRLVGDADPFEWARENLSASPGARVLHLATLRTYRIPTLVLAHKPDGSCKFLAGVRCTIHDDAPFACSFFGCGATRESEMAMKGIHEVAEAMADAGSLYHQVWEVLNREGLVSPPPEIKRAAMKRARPIF